MRRNMSRLQARPLLAVAALAAISGCAAETGYQLPDLPQSGGGGVYAPYAVYRPGYYFGYPGYDPRYYGYGAYNPYAYQGGPYPYGYGYGYYPYPRYVVVPCVDNNHDGRCDRHPGRHDDNPRQGGNGQGGHSPGDHHDGGKNRGGGKDGRPRDGEGSTTAPVRPSVPDWKQPKATRTQPQRERDDSTRQQ
jgi:hypothetical protein